MDTWTNRFLITKYTLTLHSCEGTIQKNRFPTRLASLLVTAYTPFQQDMCTR